MKLLLPSCLAAVCLLSLDACKSGPAPVKIAGTCLFKDVHEVTSSAGNKMAEGEMVLTLTGPGTTPASIEIKRALMTSDGFGNDEIIEEVVIDPAASRHMTAPGTVTLPFSMGFSGVSLSLLELTLNVDGKYEVVEIHPTVTPR